MHSTDEIMKRLILEQSSEEFSTSHSGLALAGACINRYSDLGRYVGRVTKGSDHITEIDILRSYLSLLCPSQSDYQAIAAMREEDYFKQALSIGRIPSVERLRQRLDEAASDLAPVLNQCSRIALSGSRPQSPVSGTVSSPWMCMSFPSTTPTPGRKVQAAHTRITMVTLPSPPISAWRNGAWRWNSGPEVSIARMGTC